MQPDFLNLKMSVRKLDFDTSILKMVTQQDPHH